MITNEENNKVFNNSLHTRHFMETGKIHQPTENVEILKVENNLNERKLYEELKMLKYKRRAVLYL